MSKMRFTKYIVSFLLLLIIVFLFIQDGRNKDYFYEWDMFSSTFGRAQMEFFVEAIRNEDRDSQIAFISDLYRTSFTGTKIYDQYTYVNKEDPHRFIFSYVAAVEIYSLELRESYLSHENTSDDIALAEQTFSELIEHWKYIDIDNSISNQINTMMCEVDESNKIALYYFDVLKKTK